MNNEKWIDKLHETEILILDEFDRICKKNNINYFMIGGTLIGAVRHKGFIPWDDDIDLGMPREDFNKFIECCKDDLSDKFFLDSYPSNPKSFHLYAKLRYKNTLCLEKSLQGLDVDNEIWIDIFPYDNIDELNSKDHIKMNNFRKKIEKLLYAKIKIKQPQFRKKYKFLIPILTIFLAPISRKKLIGTANKVISKNHDNNSKYLSTMTGFYPLEKETHLREDIFPTINLEFEGKKYPCPKNYDKILTKIYGDYMQIPPVEKRVTHNPAIVKFPDGEIIDFLKMEEDK